MMQVIAALALGALIGRSLRGQPVLAHVGKLTMAGVAGLLLVMGAQIGSNPQVLKALPTLGSRAIVFALASIIGSVLLSLTLVRRKSA